MNALVDLASKDLQLVDKSGFFIDELLIFVVEEGCDKFDVVGVGLRLQESHDLFRAHLFELVAPQ